MTPEQAAIAQAFLMAAGRKGYDLQLAANIALVYTEPFPNYLQCALGETKRYIGVLYINGINGNVYTLGTLN